jgi:predicted metal-binding protein
LNKRNNSINLSDLAVQLGAVDAKIIPTYQVVVRNAVRWKCRFGCKNYGKSLMCPPHTPTPEEMKKLLTEYEKVVLFRFKPDSKSLVVELEKQVFLLGYPNALAFSAGPCKLCEDCDVEAGYCIKPDEARPSMEGCGIDVFETAKNAGYDMKVLTSRDQEYLWYGLLLTK